MIVIVFLREQFHVAEPGAELQQAEPEKHDAQRALRERCAVPGHPECEAGFERAGKEAHGGTVR